MIVFAIANGCCENCNWIGCMSTASPIFHQVHNYDAKESMLPASPSENSAYIVTGRGSGTNVKTLAALASAVATVVKFCVRIALSILQMESQPFSPQVFRQ